MAAWVIRAGRSGEREHAALERGVAGVAFPEIPDLTNADTREDVRAAVDLALSSSPSARRANFAGQLWALRGVVAVGDLIVMPLKSAPRLAIGRCTGGYWFQGDQSGLGMHHLISVDWKATDIPRAAVKADLLNTLNGAKTVFQAWRNNAERRLQKLLEHRDDPGNGESIENTSSNGVVNETSTPADSDIVDPPPLPTLEAIRDQVRRHLIENFKGHVLTDLVAEILRVHGYTCEISPPGPDHGVDIIGGQGPLGLDTPLIVEVKSEESPIGSPVVRGLTGAMAQHSADQGLLVAWGGLTKPAEEEIRTQRLRLRIWDAENLLDNLFRTYDRLPDHIRTAIPLERAWVLNEENG